MEAGSVSRRSVPLHPPSTHAELPPPSGDADPVSCLPASGSVARPAVLLASATSVTRHPRRCTTPPPRFVSPGRLPRRPPAEPDVSPRRSHAAQPAHFASPPPSASPPSLGAPLANSAAGPSLPNTPPQSTGERSRSANPRRVVVPPPSPPVWLKLYQGAAERRARQRSQIEAERLRKREEELQAFKAECTFKPTITAVARDVYKRAGRPKEPPQSPPPLEDSKLQP
eukprot:EG_transcript_14233